MHAVHIRPFCVSSHPTFPQINDYSNIVFGVCVFYENKRRGKIRKVGKRKERKKERKKERIMESSQLVVFELALIIHKLSLLSGG